VIASERIPVHPVLAELDASSAADADRGGCSSVRSRGHSNLSCTLDGTGITATPTTTACTQEPGTEGSDRLHVPRHWIWTAPTPAPRR